MHIKKKIVSAVFLFGLTIIITILVNCHVEETLQENYGITQVIYQPGDIVPFEMDDTQDGPLDGYSIRVDDAIIMNYDEFMKLIGESIDTDIGNEPPDKVCLITTTISNEHSIYEGPYLTNIVLHGLNFIPSLSKPLTVLANPFLKEAFGEDVSSEHLRMNMLGISVLEESDATVQLVYGLYEESFTRRTWENIDNEKMYLCITYSPTQKKIQIN